jgi:hypothetical protein
VQTVRDGHDTAWRTLPYAWRGWGTCTNDQRWPFHRSASVSPSYSPCVAIWLPTTKQNLREGHDTPDKRPSLVCLAPGWMDHLAPFQRSSKVRELSPVTFPTATQNLGAAHDTAVNSLLVDCPDGGGRTRLGVLWMDQVLPFHASASVSPPEAT